MPDLECVSSAPACYVQVEAMHQQKAQGKRKASSGETSQGCATRHASDKLKQRGVDTQTLIAVSDVYGTRCAAQFRVRSGYGR